MELFHLILQSIKSIIEAKFTFKEQAAIAMASVGGFIELYDFAVYCFYAMYFSHRVFPMTRVSPIIYVFGIFTIGVLMKPVGIYLYQKIGRKFSLKYSLNLSMFFITIGFLLLACLPTYKYIGVYSGVILIFARMLQGIACGVEVQGMIQFVLINLARSKKKFAISGYLLGMELGLLFGILLNKLLVMFLNDIRMEVWGWRIPFFIGSFVSIIFFILRGKIGKFKVRQSSYYHKINILTMFTRYKKFILLYVGLIGILTTLLVNGIIFMPIYLHDFLNMNYDCIGSLIFNAAIFGLCIAYVLVLITKVMNPITVLKLAIFSVIPVTIISYMLFAFERNMSLGVYLLISYYSIFGMLIPKILDFEFFPSYLRLTNISIVLHIGMIFIGGITPLITSILITFTNSVFLAPCIYTTIMAIISLICLQSLLKISKSV